VAAGATTVNLPDTVGYTTPAEHTAFFEEIRGRVPELAGVVLSSHCHNDLGLAVANSLAAVRGGARQVECTVNGIGERAGNAAMEEIVMALYVRRNLFGVSAGVNTTEIMRSSGLLSRITGVKVQPNKAIVGENAFAHEAGVHQHGVKANRNTYEIMTPESVGISKNLMVLGKHSGRHAFDDRLKELGFNLDTQALDAVFAEFKKLADRKKTVNDRDIEALVLGASAAVPETWALDQWLVNSVSGLSSTATIRLRHKDGAYHELAACEDGPLHAAFEAINRIAGLDPAPELELYELGSITGGSSAQGETRVKIVYDGRHYNGRGLSTDVVESSIKAYVAAINALAADRR
jgi:2-isopropylmalate synthase